MLCWQAGSIEQGRIALPLYTSDVTTGRRVPLFDPAARPSTWAERMAADEYAVHFTEFESPEERAQPYCVVFGSLAEATAFAQAEVARRPRLRCRLYDHQGFIGAPAAEIRGADYKDKVDISPTFRRWGGLGMLVGGGLLYAIDAAGGYRWLWPSMLGSRLAMPGAILVVMEAFILLHRRSERQKASV